MTSQRTTQGARPTFRRGGRRRRQCFCKESKVDYKDVSNIRRFITDRGRIEAGKKSGNCAKCQRTLTLAIKRARHLALIPYAPHHLRVTGEVAVSAKIDEEDVIDASEESEEITESTEQTQADLESPAADMEPESESEIQSDVPATITETKIDEEDLEDSGNGESELAETPNVESPDSEPDSEEDK